MSSTELRDSRQNDHDVKQATGRDNDEARDNGTDSLPEGWRQIHGAIWLLGLAIIAWKGWWWPGILVLVAISTLVQAGIQLYLKRTQEQKLVELQREMLLPEACPNCGGPLNATSVYWKSDSVANCPYCGTSVKAVRQRH